MTWFVIRIRLLLHSTIHYMGDEIFSKLQCLVVFYHCLSELMYIGLLLTKVLGCWTYKVLALIHKKSFLIQKMTKFILTQLQKCSLKYGKEGVIMLKRTLPWMKHQKLSCMFSWNRKLSHTIKMARMRNKVWKGFSLSSVQNHFIKLIMRRSGINWIKLIHCIALMMTASTYKAPGTVEFSVKIILFLYMNFLSVLLIWLNNMVGLVVIQKKMTLRNGWNIKLFI